MDECDDPSPSRFTELAKPVTLATELANPETLAKLAENPEDVEEEVEDDVACVCGEWWCCDAGGGGGDFAGLAFKMAACCCSSSAILVPIPLNMVCVAWMSSTLPKQTTKQNKTKKERKNDSKYHVVNRRQLKVMY